MRRRFSRLSLDSKNCTSSLVEFLSLCCICLGYLHRRSSDLPPGRMPPQLQFVQHSSRRDMLDAFVLVFFFLLQSIILFPDLILRHNTYSS